MKKIDSRFIHNISEQAKSSGRLRINYNFHEKMDDTLQRMINAMEPGTYVQPHKHEDPDKREAFIILRGKVVVVEFSPEGEIVDHFILDPKARNYGIEIAPGTWHSLIALEPDSVLYEVKDGPYDPGDDKHFATWAPKEGDDGCDTFLKKTLDKLAL